MRSSVRLGRAADGLLAACGETLVGVAAELARWDRVAGAPLQFARVNLVMDLLDRRDERAVNRLGPRRVRWLRILHLAHPIVGVQVSLKFSSSNTANISAP